MRPTPLQRENVSQASRLECPEMMLYSNVVPELSLKKKNNVKKYYFIRKLTKVTLPTTVLLFILAYFQKMDRIVVSETITLRHFTYVRSSQ